MIAITCKMWAGINQDGTGLKLSCKGIQKDKNEITYQRFHDVLFEGVKDRVTNKGFRYQNNNHCMHTYTQEKVGLSAIYCKRELLADGISTKPLNI